MRRTAILLSAAGLLAIAGVMFGLRGSFVAPPDIGAGQQPERAEPAPRPRSVVNTAKQARIRRVAPDVVAQPQVAPEELERVEPRQPLSRFGRPLPQRPKHQGRIFRPLVAAAGRVAGSGLIVTIAGIEVTLPDRSCVDADGRSWPCGIRARAAFRAFVRGRALACDLPEELTQAHYTVSCTLGKQDVGAWLAAQGWARALPGGPYEDAGEAARSAGKGIFGAAPVVEPVETLPAAEIPAGTLPPLD